MSQVNRPYWVLLQKKSDIRRHDENSSITLYFETGEAAKEMAAKLQPHLGPGYEAVAYGPTIQQEIVYRPLP